MNGIDPYEYLNKVSASLASLNERAQIETVLDEVEYLFEVIPPEMQELADPIISQLRAKLENAK